MGNTCISGEASGRMTQSRSSRGPISFVQASVDGSFVEVENNTSGSKSKTQNLKGWTLRKQRPGKDDINYRFGDISLSPGQKYRIYANGNPPAKGEHVGCSYCVDEHTYTFGSGSGTLCLLDGHEEKATLKSTISNLK